jgi:peptidyl-prolyl cis-trans isomerase C
MAKEPDRITVQHVLLSFAGAGTDATRSKAEAEKLAKEVLERAKKGEDFGGLVKQLSDDPGEGIYGMANRGVREVRGEYPRDGMVPAFGNVGFALEAGGVGLAPYDPQASPFGWHVIKRLK